MEKRGSNPGELLAVLASSSAMAETIPPSIVLIVVGSATGISIGALFLSGLFPALVCALALVLVVGFRSRNEPAPGGFAFSLKAFFTAFYRALPALILLAVIRAAVIKGIATPTEVGTVGISYVLIYSVLFIRRLGWRTLYSALVQTCVLTGVVLLIVGTAAAMAWTLTISGFSSELVAAMRAVAGSAFGFLIVSVILFAVLGCVLEGLPVLVLFGPLMFPIARTMGINEVHYAMVVIIAMGIGLHAPPIGVGYYTACAIAKVDPDYAMKRMWPYLGALLLALLLIAAVPWISTLALH
jgi:tripartite ATP-independent transporter DctM subunit